MPHFEFELNDDDTIRTIFKDGVAVETSLRLEMPTAIVHIYFNAAIRNLAMMTKSDEDREVNRHHGLLCFLMSLVGIEAFLNVFFHLVGRERDLPAVVEMANKDNLRVDHKLAHLPRHAYGSQLAAQKRLTRKVRELYNLRSQIVHPKWKPSSFAMPGLRIEGLVENMQQLFEDRDFCTETLQWCLVVVARVGMHASGGQDSEHFMQHWTGQRETNANLSDALGIPRDGP